MKIRVSFNNEAGELDSRIVTSEEAACEAAIEMLRQAGSLYDGDSITAEEFEE